VLRAARFETRYGFAIDGSTESLLRQAVEMGMLPEVSGARIREEMLDIIDEEHVVSVLRRLDDLGAFATLLPDGADRERVLSEVTLVDESFSGLSPRFPRPPRRRVALTTPLAATSSRVGAERWARRLRFGKEYAAPALSIVERRDAILGMLRDGRKMRDSRLYFLLQPLPEEALVYLWAVGEQQARERVERYLDVLSEVRITVSGDDLTDLGMEPGPGYSAILAQALGDRLDGRAVGREAELANLKRLARPRRAK
jgi:tRNA nucleotidyltransferase (CCA-adding enzyme)